MVIVESGLNSEQVPLTRPTYTEKCILVLKQVVLIERVVLLISGLNNGILLNNMDIMDHKTLQRFKNIAG